MIELTKGQSGEKIIITLTELKTLDEPNFLFIFTHTLTKETVVFIKLNIDDESDYPSRYNQFDINTAALFGTGKPTGEWLYRIYEQVSAMNTDPDLATGVVENGKMLLYPAAADIFDYEKYDEPVTFKQYNG
jgi:hypothetical protein